MANIAGNDSEAARKDLDKQYGDHASAEDLIRAHDEAVDAGLQAALSKPVDPVATEALDYESIKPRYKDGEVVAACVRGGYLVVVEEAFGQHLKWGEPHEGGTARARQAGRQASASVGGDPDKPGGAPEAKGSTGGAPASPPNAPDAGADLEEAPQNVTSQKIQDRLAELQIDVGDSTRKQQFWDLLPENEQVALKEAADAA